MFVEYTIEDTNGSLRAGYIKSIWNMDRTTIKWTEDATDSIGDTSSYVFTIYDDGTNIVLVLYNNSSSYSIYANITSRLVARPYHP